MQGAKDRTLYLVESGNLTVHFEDSAGYIRQAMVGAGSAVGEGSFFSHLPRSATVQAATPGEQRGGGITGHEQNPTVPPRFLQRTPAASQPRPCRARGRHRCG